MPCGCQYCCLRRCHERCYCRIFSGYFLFLFRKILLYFFSRYFFPWSDTAIFGKKCISFFSTMFIKREIVILLGLSFSIVLWKFLFGGQTLQLEYFLNLLSIFRCAKSTRVFFFVFAFYFFFVLMMKIHYHPFCNSWSRVARLSIQVRLDLTCLCNVQTLGRKK